ncbi:hypothetical protein LC612_19570 [Nostoc sp. CHAB 5834]|nr:hypothetical protein [Nostoc sp. CHAB 5834]
MNFIDGTDGCNYVIVVAIISPDSIIASASFNDSFSINAIGSTINCCPSLASQDVTTIPSINYSVVGNAYDDEVVAS